MKQKNILIINICKEKLHYYEFVKPIEDILREKNIIYSVKQYKEIKKKDIDNSDKIIICGTSLFDNDFIKNIKEFSWIKEYNKPLLGICGGMQIIQLIFYKDMKDKLIKKTEIGYYHEFFIKDFLGFINMHEVYHLHNNYIKNPDEFQIFSITEDKKIAQAIKHKVKPIYGVLFHPEVRGKDLIERFCFI